MFRAIPSSNRICTEKKKNKDQSLHLKKIREMKPFIDIMEPTSYGFMNSRKKKEQMQEIRMTEIDRENKILLEKISTIMTKIPQIDPSKKKKKITTNFWETSNKNSLNKTYRKNELLKITFENQALLQRIQDKKASFNFKKMEKERKENEKLLENISLYPLQIYNSNIFLDTSNKNDFMSGGGNLEKTSKFSQTQNKETKKFHKNNRMQPLETDTKKYVNERVVLFKNSRKIEDNYVLLEVVMENNVLKIIADDVSMTKPKILEIPYNEAHILLKKFKNNIENLVQNIKVEENSRIVIEGTPYVFKEKTLKKDKTPEDNFAELLEYPTVKEIKVVIKNSEKPQEIKDEEKTIISKKIDKNETEVKTTDNKEPEGMKSFKNLESKSKIHDQNQNNIEKEPEKNKEIKSLKNIENKEQNKIADIKEKEPEKNILL